MNKSLYLEKSTGSGGDHPLGTISTCINNISENNKKVKSDISNSSNMPKIL